MKDYKGSAKPLPEKKAEGMPLKPAVVKMVSDQHADFQPNRAKPMVGGTVDICKAYPAKGV
jgi:hypothetical protein